MKPGSNSTDCLYVAPVVQTKTTICCRLRIQPEFHILLNKYKVILAVVSRYINSQGAISDNCRLPGRTNRIMSITTSRLATWKSLHSRASVDTLHCIVCIRYSAYRWKSTDYGFTLDYHILPSSINWQLSDRAYVVVRMPNKNEPVGTAISG